MHYDSTCRNFTMKKNILCFLFLSILSIRAIAQDQVIVFVQKGELVSEDFKNNSYPELEVFANKQNIDITIIDVLEKGAPPEVMLTPMLVFQNERGRSFYKGRYLMLPKIKNFIRTVRRVPQENTIEKAGEHPVWISGKSVSKAKIKVTELSGDLPVNFNQAAFLAEGKKCIKKAFTKFKLKPEKTLHRSNRSFYLIFIHIFLPMVVSPFLWHSTLCLIVLILFMFNLKILFRVLIKNERQFSIRQPSKWRLSLWINLRT